MFFEAVTQSELFYDCRFTANQFVLAPSPSRLTTRVFFNWTRERWVSLLWICLAFCQVYISHVIKHSFLCTVYKSSVSTGFAKQIMSILRILCYNGSMVTWTVVTFTTATFKSLYFLCLVSPSPIPRTCSFSWFCMTSVCCLHNFVI
jgi:hypothetical protein